MKCDHCGRKVGGSPIFYRESRSGGEPEPVGLHRHCEKAYNQEEEPKTVRRVREESGDEAASFIEGFLDDNPDVAF